MLSTLYPRAAQFLILRNSRSEGYNRGLRTADRRGIQAVYSD